MDGGGVEGCAVAFGSVVVDEKYFWGGVCRGCDESDEEGNGYGLEVLGDGGHRYVPSLGKSGQSLRSGDLRGGLGGLSSRACPFHAARFGRYDGFLGGGSSRGGLGYEMDGAEDAGGDGFDLVEVLHLEAVAVFFDERFVVAGRERGPGVEGSVVDVHLDVVLAGFEIVGDVEAVRWVPERTDTLAVNENDCGFADGWVVVCVHARAGAGDAWVRKTVGA